MFVLSKAQIQQLLRRDEPIGGTLLDIGAGDGNVTASIASLVDNVRATEVSPPMVKNLNRMGFNAVETCDLDIPHVLDGAPYNIIR
jgi:16S rRNA A1518/A1519 N6-dimethyltransferase RsmA/KsgA/DIM1 with predicted DNA glycosylase/AP lyase activity